MVKIFNYFFVAALLLPNAHAVPILWTLEDVNFSTGNPAAVTGSANGSFIYDADTAAYSSVSVTTSAGEFIKCSDIGIPGDDTCNDFATLLPFVWRCLQCRHTDGVSVSSPKRIQYCRLC